MAKGDRPWISASDHATFIQYVMELRKRYDSVVNWWPERAAEYKTRGEFRLHMTQYLDPATRGLVPRQIIEDADVKNLAPEVEAEYEAAKHLAKTRRQIEGSSHITVCGGGLPSLGKRR